MKEEGRMTLVLKKNVKTLFMGFEDLGSGVFNIHIQDETGQSIMIESAMSPYVPEIIRKARQSGWEEHGWRKQIIEPEEIWEDIDLSALEA